MFALVFGSALLAMRVQRLLPEHHVSTDTKDVVKLGVALIATMSALVLSLLIASAKSAFDTRSNQVVKASADIMLLDRVLARYGPETNDPRAALQRSVAAAVERVWPEDEDARPITMIGERLLSRLSATKSMRYRRKARHNARCALRP